MQKKNPKKTPNPPEETLWDKYLCELQTETMYCHFSHGPDFQTGKAM